MKIMSRNPETGVLTANTNTGTGGNGRVTVDPNNHAIRFDGYFTVEQLYMILEDISWWRRRLYLQDENDALRKRVEELEKQALGTASESKSGPDIVTCKTCSAALYDEAAQIGYCTHHEPKAGEIGSRCPEHWGKVNMGGVPGERQPAIYPCCHGTGLLKVDQNACSHKYTTSRPSVCAWCGKRESTTSTIKPNGLTWSEVSPTEPGLYWMTTLGMRPMVSVVEIKSPNLDVYLVPGFAWQKISDGMLWAGPIAPESNHPACPSCGAPTSIKSNGPCENTWHGDQLRRSKS